MSFQLNPNDSPQGSPSEFGAQQPTQQSRRKSPLARLLNVYTILGLIFLLVGGYLAMFVDLSISTEFNRDTFFYLGRYALVLLGIFLVVKGRNKAASDARAASSQF